jgi:ribosomal protein S27AE
MATKIQPGEGTIRRIQKLVMFAERAGGSEANNARNILAKLLEKYDVSIEALQERFDHQIAVDHRMVDATVQLVTSMGLSIFSRPKNKGGHWYSVRASDAEYKAFEALFADLKAMFRQRLNAAILEAAGYVYGYAMKCYPAPDSEDRDPTPCPHCDAAMVYDDDRWVCPECGYKGRKSRRRGADMNAARQGFKDGARKLTMKEG